MKSKDVDWFKIHFQWKEIFQAIPGDEIKTGILESYKYWECRMKEAEYTPQLTKTGENVIFNILKNSIDQAYIDSFQRSAQGQNAANSRWEKEKEPEGQLSEPLVSAETDYFDQGRTMDQQIRSIAKGYQSRNHR